MGNKKSTNNSIPPYAAPPPPPMYDLPNGGIQTVVTSISIETPRLKQRPLGRSRNRLLPKIRAIFIPQARPAGIGVLPMTCAAPVTNPCANLGIGGYGAYGYGGYGYGYGYGYCCYY
ncbi:unnamed protein product [Rotaria sp. Silwood1]|nr:unnamed protein product [Rotaria sp. Silwood1]CAF1354298.1 unnamed protein product [Rotaria sp. Silwood1]CAF3554809.1 unnamed protein product [Rotaria sp. Silwood1]CAF4667432.1 unnamed protein product [Rotaria sp. Silwood1]CAF4971263.1 unnamed protein product [Rotaria sp. Silwood1]